MDNLEQFKADVAATPDEPDQQENALQPAAERLTSLDFIRGIAVLGILWANIVAFGQPMTAYMWPGAFTVPHGQLSEWMWGIQFLIVDGKMRGLFTLMFGAGMMLFMHKAWARGAGKWLQARRLSWLMVFGAIHFYLIWRGDILMMYAFAGLLGLMCVGWKPRTQLIAGIAGFVVGSLVFLVMVGPLHFIADTDFDTAPAYADMRGNMIEGREAEIADGVRETAIISAGNYPAFVRHNFSSHLSDPLSSFTLSLMETMPLMLIGMGLYGLGFFSGGIDPAKMRRWGWAGVIAGSLATIPIVLWAYSTGLSYFATLGAFVGFSALPRLPVIIGIAALLTLLAPSAKGWLGVRLVAAGRMAFSNYLGTSILMMLVFHGWAGGLFGQLGRPELMGVVIAAWALMLAWSKPWLEHFRYGPLEWLWRCLTYGRIFPIKR